MTKAIIIMIALVLSYVGVIVVAGHGLGPVALILVAGRAPEYIPIMVLGWAGILALLAAIVRSRDGSARRLLVLAAGLLGLSWLGVVWVSQLRAFTLATSVPFLVLAGWVLARRGQVSAVGGQPTRAEP